MCRAPSSAAARIVSAPSADASQERKDCLGGAAVSRLSLQPLSGAGRRERVPSRPPATRPRAAAFWAAVKSFGLLITPAAAFIASFSAVVPACSVCWWRSSTSIEGMSIFTGQASKHAPQRLEAYGSELLGSPFAASMPASCGVRTAPIGPGYVDP